MMNCPSCKEGELFLKDESTYVYTYRMDEDGWVKWKDQDGYTSYLFVDREQKDFNQYVECSHCKKIFEHSIDSSEHGDMIILKKAIHSNGPISNDFFV